MSSPTRRLFRAHLCSPVLDDCNGRPAAQVVINFSPAESSNYKFGSFVEVRSYPARSPLQGECRRFDPVSTHQSNQLSDHCVNWRTVLSGLAVVFGQGAPGIL